MKVRVTQQSATQIYYTLYMNTTQFQTWIFDPSWSNGDHGIMADGGTGFNNLFVSTPTSCTITLTSCGLSNAQIINSISVALGIDASSIVGLTRGGCGTTTSKKRIVVDQVTSETVSANILGNKIQSSSEIASQLNTNSHPSFGQVSTGGSTISDLSTVVPVALTAVIPVVAGLTTAAIVGIAVGSAVGVAGIAGAIGGIIHYKKNKNKSKSKSEEMPEKEPEREPEVIVEPEQPKKQKPKGATVNIFELNPNDPQSITARSPAIKNNNAV